MNGARELASVASLLGDTTRSRRLIELMDGRARTATELALAGGVSASTASSHLARLTKGGLLAVRQVGRQVAVSWGERVGIDIDGPRASRRLLNRTCLDWSERSPHLAGRHGRAILDRLLSARYANRIAGSRVIELSPRGEDFIARLQLAR
jgi:DNA-binding transcriptional ArsR family regulator